MKFYQVKRVNKDTQDRSSKYFFFINKKKKKNHSFRGALKFVFQSCVLILNIGHLMWD